MLPTIEGMKFKNDELESCSVSTGGGMLGGNSGAYLSRDNDGNAVLEIRKRETHADREITTTYKVDNAAFDHIRGIVVKCDLYAASKKGYSEFQALDADTTTLHFSFSEGSFSISDEQELDRKMRDGFNEVEAYLYSLAQGEGITTMEPQTAMLYLKSGYTFTFIVEDAFDSKLDNILSEEKEVVPQGSFGILLNTADGLDTSGAEALETGAAGTIVYDSTNGQVVILYEDHEFGYPVYQLAHLEWMSENSFPLIAEMEGVYRLHFN